MMGGYKVFVSGDYDWYVAAKREDEGVDVLYEGHDLERAYLSILTDIGLDPPLLEREMDSGTYVPTLEDFLEE